MQAPVLINDISFKQLFFIRCYTGDSGLILVRAYAYWAIDVHLIYSTKS